MVAAKPLEQKDSGETATGRVGAGAERCTSDIRHVLEQRWETAADLNSKECRESAAQHRSSITNQA